MDNEENIETPEVTEPEETEEITAEKIANSNLTAEQIEDAIYRGFKKVRDEERANRENKIKEIRERKQAKREREINERKSREAKKASWI